MYYSNVSAGLNFTEKVIEISECQCCVQILHVNLLAKTQSPLIKNKIDCLELFQ